MNPKTLAELAALIVDEADLARLGRWGGEPQPQRWVPAWTGDAVSPQRWPS
jgi:hypothetical protein